MGGKPKDIIIDRKGRRLNPDSSEYQKASEEIAAAQAGNGAEWAKAEGLDSGAPPVPDLTDKVVRAAQLAERQRQMAGRGRKSTFLTGYGVDKPTLGG